MNRARTTILSFLWLCAIVGCAGTTAFAGYFYRTQQDSAARNALADKFGADIRTICSTLPTKANGKLSSPDNKFLVINSRTGQLFTLFQESLDASLVAASRDDLTAIVCVAPSRKLVDSCEYSPNGANGEKTDYVVTRFENDLKVTLIDMATGNTASVSTLAGDDPAECPQTTKESKTIDGVLPNADDFTNWLKRAAKIKAQ